MENLIFATENLETIIKVACLQKEINLAYQKLLTFKGIEYKTYTGTQTLEITSKRTIKHHIDLYKICHGEKPVWANDVLKAYNNFEKLENEYTTIEKDLAGEYGYINVTLKVCH